MENIEKAILIFFENKFRITRIFAFVNYSRLDIRSILIIVIKRLIRDVVNNRCDYRTTNAKSEFTNILLRSAGNFR